MLFRISTKFVTSDAAMRETRSTSCSLWNVFWLASRSEVWSDLSLFVRVDGEETSLVLHSLLGSANDDFLGALLLINLWSLISDLTITGHGSVNFSHF